MFGHDLPQLLPQLVLVPAPLWDRPILAKSFLHGFKEVVEVLSVRQLRCLLHFGPFSEFVVVAILEMVPVADRLRSLFGVPWSFQSCEVGAGILLVSQPIREVRHLTP